MAYVNVAEWKTEQVCEWLKGLENSVLPYVHSFMNHGVNGQQLLSLRPEDLEHFGVVKLGHQEIILQAVEYLRNFHYELDRENLQLLALRLSCQAHSLHNELSRQTDSKPVTTQTLSDVASVMTAVKPLVRWLDCSPFSGQLEYNDKKNELMKLALEMATCAQRDRFAEKPIEEIRTICCQLAKLADYIIQDIPDPMILQPASLDLATLKKKPGDDLGFHILPSFHGAHQIAEIKFGSAAHQCGKMEEGDEIVQVNYQTVVGWERKNLLELFRESPAEVLLTLKRRPRHTKVYGQIYIKPYRLPSNKKISYTTRWQHNLPSPRPELLTIPDFTMPLPRHMPKNPSPEPASILDTVNILDTMIIDSSDSDSEAEPPLPTRLYSAKPRNLVQRRATITGASPTTKHGIDIEQFWKELKQEHSTTFQLRDKAASCAHGLDNVPSNLRPQTCLGIEQNKRRKRVDAQIDEKKVHFQDKAGECNSAQASDVANIHECENESNFKNPNSGTSNMKSTSLTGQAFQSVSTVTESYKGSDVSVPLDECNNLISNRSNCNKKAGSGKESNIRNIKDRGKLDKSHSTPAYDFADTDDIEDRKQKLLEQSTSVAAGTLAHHSNKTPKSSMKTEIRVTVDDYDEQQQILNNAEQNHKTNHLSDNVTLNANSLDSCVSQDHSVQQSVSGLAEESKLFGSMTNVQTVELISEDALKNNQSNNISTDLIVNTEIDSSTGRALNTLIENMPCNAEQDKNKEIVHSKNEQAESRLESVVENNSTLDVREKLSEDTATIEDAKINNTESSSVMLNCKDQRKEERNLKGSKHSDEDNLQNACTKTSQVSPEFKPQNDNASVVDSPDEGSPTQPCKYVELVNIESGKKLEGRSLIPPDPPPRKYHTKSPATQIMNTSMDSNSRNSEDRDNVYVPERPIVRRDLKKPELYTESYGRSTDRQERRNSYDIYSNFVDKSVEFADASGSALNNSRLSFDLDNCPYIDSSNKHVKEERIICDKYDHFTETAASSNQIPWEYSRTEHFRNIDSPDGSPYSKQHVDYKFKTLEKDKNVEKGVVNKAMMVARSIGLHGSLSKTTNSSPRSSRKQSILFARKRNVSVKDLGAGDLEGWLTYRSRGAGGAWAKAWFVLKCPSLYRFKMLESIKADCLIALTGFTVSQAAEVKSRKYAFKVYHTGTVFYFAADTEDSLAMWLDAINKATLGADGHTRSSTLFSETDESDSENKYKGKTSPALENKPNSEKSFGSLKKVTRKDSGCKDSDIGGASLDRKYLKFLGARSQNVPVPTAQFRSYRRVLPNSTPNKKQNPTPSSPDLQMTIAGSTFYGLCTSQSASDMATNTQDMGDYRRTTDRCFNNRNRRVDDLQGFITLEEFMLSQQSEERRQTAGNRSVSPRATPLTSDHVHVQYTNLHDNGASGEQSRHVSEASFSNDVIEFGSRGHDEASCNSIPYGYSRNTDNTHTARQYNGNHSLEQIETRSEYSKAPVHKKFRDSYTSKRTLQDSSSTSEARSYDVVYLKNNTASRKPSSSLYCNKSDPVHAAAKQMESEYDQQPRASNHPMEPWNNCEISKSRDYFSSRNFANLIEDIKSVPKKLVRNDGHSGSSSDLTSHASYESFQRVKKEATVSRKGSFNLSKHRENTSTDRHWLESLKRTDKKNNSDKSRLKNVAQYQPPPIASSPFEQDGMRAAFEMHLDKAEQVQKPNRLKSLFGSKTHQKPCTLELPKDSPKTLLGSPRLHRAVFRDKSSNQLQHRLCSDSCYHSPSDSGVSQGVSSFSGTNSSHTLSQSFSSASSISDWSPETPSSGTPNASRCPAGHLSCHKGFANHGRHSATPPTLPYIPPPTSPPPDYPGLEYPPVFEPGTYSLSDASVLRSRNKDVRNSS